MRQECKRIPKEVPFDRLATASKKYPRCQPPYPRCQPPDFCYQLCTPKGVHKHSHIFRAWINSCILTTFVISTVEIMDHPAVLANPIHVCHSLPKFNYIVTTGSSGGLLSRKNNVSCTDGRHVRRVNGIRWKVLCTDMQLWQGWVITWKSMILISSIWYTQIFPFDERDPSLKLCTRFTLCYVLLCLVLV